MNTMTRDEAKLSGRENIPNETAQPRGNNLRVDLVNKIPHNNGLEVSDTNRIHNFLIEGNQTGVGSLRQIQSGKHISDGIRNLIRNDIPTF